MDARHAVAEAWASMDGKLEGFVIGKTDAEYEETVGYYRGYLADADELISRIEKRGFRLVPA